MITVSVRDVVGDRAACVRVLRVQVGADVTAVDGRVDLSELHSRLYTVVFQIPDIRVCDLVLERLTGVDTVLPLLRFAVLDGSAMLSPLRYRTFHPGVKGSRRFITDRRGIVLGVNTQGLSPAFQRVRA
jgi:hypothetical protein